ncbi:MAG: thiamine-phosphate kinase [Gammaproteobacteria bacterium]|nr:thiamine-phosphate kinase [Gammaproteobacteria bacterium]
MSRRSESSAHELISRAHSDPPGAGEAHAGVVPAVGDEHVAIAIDSLAEGVHFRPEADAECVAWKSLAVNLSDLAAMGASPVAAAVSLSWPASRRSWLEGFRRGLAEASAAFAIEIVAATIEDGPAVVTVEVFGAVPPGLALTRGGARPGDRIFVTGTVGDAGLGLAASRDQSLVSSDDYPYLIDRLDRPTPRLSAGLALRGIASAAIDISDGLAGDLAHVLEKSGVGAGIRIDDLPRSAQFRRNVNETDGLRLAASAGDDYELCFTVPETGRGPLAAARNRMDVGITEIGVIEARPGLRFTRADGTAFEAGAAFDHFA